MPPLYEQLLYSLPRHSLNAAMLAALPPIALRSCTELPQCWRWFFVSLSTTKARSCYFGW